MLNHQQDTLMTSTSLLRTYLCESLLQHLGRPDNGGVVVQAQSQAGNTPVVRET